MIKVALSLLIAGAWLPLTASNAEARNKFFCGTYDGAPSTMSNTSSGKQVAVIMWKSTAFSGSGYDPRTRCQIVSNRFNELYNQGLLTHLTTGRKNGMNIICGASSNGGGCARDGMLYTLKPGQDPTQTLKNLLAVRTKATSALTESASRLYISIEEIEEAQDPDATYTVTKPVETSPRTYTSNQTAPQTVVTPVRTFTPPTPSANETLW